jgi:hypothetical protein
VTAATPSGLATPVQRAPGSPAASTPVAGRGSVGLEGVGTAFARSTELATVSALATAEAETLATTSAELDAARATVAATGPT